MAQNVTRCKFFFFKNCDKCAARKSPPKAPRAQLQKYVVGAPMERWAIDILGPLPLTNKKNSYLMVVGDYFTKWIDAIPIRNMKANTIAQKFVNHIVSIFGVPMQIHSDQGQTFESDVFKEMCRILGIEKTRTTPYRPQSDGMIERANRTIENMLSAFVDENQKNWDDLIPLLMLAYRSSVHESTGVSPNEMVFGHSVILPVDLVFGRTNPEKCEYHLNSEYARNLVLKIEKIHEFAREKLHISFTNMAREYNSKIQQNSYDPGDAVWVFYPNHNLGLGKKLSLKWKGPYIVLRKINDVLYKIGKNSKHKGTVVHHNRLKPYTGTNLPTWFKPARF